MRTDWFDAWTSFLLMHFTHVLWVTRNINFWYAMLCIYFVNSISILLHCKSKCDHMFCMFHIIWCFAVLLSACRASRGWPGKTVEFWIARRWLRQERFQQRLLNRHGPTPSRATTDKRWGAPLRVVEWSKWLLLMIYDFSLPVFHQVMLLAASLSLAAVVF